MLIVVAFDGQSDLVELPDGREGELEDLQSRFLIWLFDRNNHHGYWVNQDCEHDGSQYGVCYRSEAFVEWLNTYIFTGDVRASVVSQYLPTIQF